MSLSAALETATGAGVSLRAGDGKLHYDAPETGIPEPVWAELVAHKAGLVEFLASIDGDGDLAPERRELIAQALDDRLRLPAYDLLGFQTVTNASRYVQWSLEQIRDGSQHRMACLAGLARAMEMSAASPDSS